LNANHVAANSVSKRKHGYYVLRTPKVPRQQAIKRLVENIKRYQVLFDKRVELRTKFPSAKKFKKNVRFRLKFKTKRILKDTIHFEKVCFRYIADDCFDLMRGTDSYKLKKNAVTHFEPKDKNKRQQQRENKTQELKKKRIKWRKMLKGMSKENIETKMEQLKTYEKQCVYRTRGIHTAGKTLQKSMFEADFSIHYDNGRFYLQTVKTLMLRSVREKNDLKVIPDVDPDVSIDPGVRKFLTLYSPSGKAEVIGSSANKILDKQIRRIDRAKAKLRGVKKRFERKKKTKKIKNRIWKVTKRYRAAERKASNVIRDLHYKAAHYICRRYKNILYPYFNSRAIAGGKLHKSTKRRLNMLSFYKFKCRLVEVSQKYSGITIRRGSEAYTTKQCGFCGTINDKLKGKEIFKCYKCSKTCDRDIHGARNIQLRNSQQN
jgi:transposase